jgi:hypothetical protein
MATRGSSAWRAAAWGPACEPDLVAMAIYAGGPRFQCDRRAREAFTRLGAVFLRHSYVVRRIGCYNCRKITGGSSMSSHSWGTSVDVNDDTNPYRLDRLVTDMPVEMIDDIEAIRTAAGVPVFRWGGDWDGRPETPHSNYDGMHFEIIATPTELAAGFIILAGRPALSHTWPVIRRGAVGPAVLELQRMLGMERVTGAGTFGPRTQTGVLLFQRSRGLVPDGIVGAATWTALYTAQPALAAGAPRPQKAAA